MEHKQEEDGGKEIYGTKVRTWRKKIKTIREY